MNILVFTSLFPNNVSPNDGVFIKERMSQVANVDRCHVRVVAPVPYFPPIKIGWRWGYSQVVGRETISGLEVFHPRYLMIPKIGMAVYGWMMFLSMLPAVRRIQREFDFDVIDAHWVYPDGFAAVLLGRWFGKPVVVSARGSDINRNFQFSLIRPLLRYTMTKADQVIAVSTALKKVIVSLGIPEAKVSVIPNGVDPLKFYPVVKEHAREVLGLPKTRRLILSTGRLVPVKGFDVLIRAFKILIEGSAKKNIELVIVGDGKERERLQRLITDLSLNEYVNLVGAISHTQLNVWYSAADIFCLCSRQEGWPNVILESMACGTPVVATSVGGIPEIVRSSVVGLLTAGNALELAETLRQALNRNWRSDEIVRYARELTWERTAQAVVHVFDSTIAQRTVVPT